MRRLVDPMRLRAAWRASDLRSLSELAKAAKIAHTTLSRFFNEDLRSGPRVRGRIKRGATMNPQTIAGLARALRVPAEWLTGDLESLPFVPKHGLLSSKAGTDPEDVTERKVRLSHLLVRVFAALRADLEAWFGDAADEAYRSWGWAVLAAVEELASPVTWRVFGVKPREGDPTVFISMENRPAVLWLEDMLAPWFDRSAYLNAESFMALFEVLFNNPERADFAAPITDADIKRALVSYTEARRRAGLQRHSGRRRRPKVPEAGERSS